MEREFVKLNGLGNDFIVMDDRASQIEMSTEQVQALCDRHFGIGADGIILVRPPKTPDSLAYMHYINSDGTLAQMCGNGVRCFAKFLVDAGIADAASGRLTAGTMAGDRPLTFTVDEEDRMLEATVDMGCPILDPSAVPTALTANAERPDGTPFVKEVLLDSPWGAFSFTCASMGNPHAVCFVEDWESLPDALFTDAQDKGLSTLRIDEAGAFFESHPAFPEKTNVEFAEVTPDGISMRVFERGCGETLACGTGACATFVSAVLTGRAQESSTVHLLGGDLQIRWDGDASVKMTGPAQEAFRGRVEV